MIKVVYIYTFHIVSDESGVPPSIRALLAKPENEERMHLVLGFHSEDISEKRTTRPGASY